MSKAIALTKTLIDSNISCEALGVIVRLIESGASATQANIAAISGYGGHKSRRIQRELMTAGYVKLKPEKDNGRFAGVSVSLTLPETMH